MPYLYILYSKKRDRFYIGSTQNFEQRFQEHQRGQTTSTRNGRPWTCAFLHETPDLKTARHQETKLKRWKSRVILQQIIDKQKFE